MKREVEKGGFEEELREGGMEEGRNKIDQKLILWW